VEPEVRRRRKKAEGDEEQASQENDGGSQSSSGVSEADADAVRKQSSGSSCRDSCQSVDSDVDSEVSSADGDAGHDSDAGDEEQQGEHPEAVHQSADEEEEIVAAIARHASGTWKVYEDLWFYMTQAPGFTDIKMHMKGPFRSVEQMGYFEMSKAVSPHHYGETRDNLVNS
jgi:hypothetical protein